MGDRANFGIRQASGNIIYVYGHWAGEGMFARFASALDRAAFRIPGDESYGTRMIISQLIGTQWSGELGWGITVNYIGDNEHNIPVYDFATDTVSLYKDEWISGVGCTLGDKIFSMDRTAFVENYAKLGV